MSNYLSEILKKDNFGFLALIDPDVKNDNILNQLIESINNSKFSAILVGGSSIEDDRYEQRLKKIKKNSTKPVILFPGSSQQISKYADAILFTSLLSGRNPKYLIDDYNIKKLLTNHDRIKLLLEGCRIPDFQKLFNDTYLQFLKTIFLLLIKNEKIPTITVELIT